MAALDPESDEAKRIDAALGAWRQGDLALGETWFVHVGDPAVPLSEAAAQAEGAGMQALTSDAAGLVVVTQTCDIVRGCTARPYVEVCPLVRVGEKDFPDVQRGRRPSLATLPCLEADRLAVDLDRIMTIEKSIVAGWARTGGCPDDAQRRAFAQALARKRVRFAFPGDFVDFAAKLRKRLIDKHDRNTEEGRGLRALREIRVLASPSWGDARVELFFWFVRDERDADFEGKSWAEPLKEWLKLVPPSGRFTAVEGQVVTLQDMSAAEFVGSDPLDLDHLSSGSGS